MRCKKKKQKRKQNSVCVCVAAQPESHHHNSTSTRTLMAKHRPNIENSIRQYQIYHFSLRLRLLAHMCGEHTEKRKTK